MTGSPDVKERLLEILFTKSFMYRENPPFKLVSGRESFYYFDCKATTLDPAGVGLVGEVMYSLLKQDIASQGITAAGGLTLGADPIAISTAIAAARDGRPLAPLIVRKEPKQHGTRKWIEGTYSPGQTVIAIDDVITTGGSTITAIERMRESGLEVPLAAVIVDRMEGGREAIEALGVKVRALFTREDFDIRRKKA